MRRGFGTVAMVAMMLVTGAGCALAQTDAGEERNTLARALLGVWLPLESGLVISAHEGIPLSAKYEIDNGAFQLSVYVVKPDVLAEVIVDHDAGMVAKVIAISDGGDLAAAQAQQMAMARARRSLATATAHAVDVNSGYRALSVTPVVRDGRPNTEVTLLRGDDWKTVVEPLD
jgi:hypothetical protein